MLNYRIAAGMREYPKSDIVRFMDLGRKVLISVGEELVASGNLGATGNLKDGQRVRANGESGIVELLD